MSRVHLVVDGSNIATEGRTAPSLAQLDEAVRSFTAQQGYDNVTVIVDATFGHRIELDERDTFEEAVLAGEMVTPPAGTIGRGDAFILQVARQADADVLSNDSFQELHAEHPWLFESGRLWGGKPVPAVGWVFVPRAPVRGVTSRRAVQAAKKAAASTALAAAPTKKAAPRKAAAAKKTAAKSTRKRAASVEAEVEVEPIVPANELTTTSRRRRRRGGSGGGADARPAVNEQAAYAFFVVDHPVGAKVDGTVDRFSSHGAYIGLDGGAVGYVALKSLGDPPPRSAREVLTLGEQRTFTVSRFDPTTRGIDVVPVDIDVPTTSRADDIASRRDEAVVAQASTEVSEPDAEEAPVSPAKKAAKKKAPAKKKATAKKRAPAKKKATAKKAPARKSTAKKAAKKKAPAKKKAAKKRAPAKKKATAKKAAKKKAPAKKKAAKKRAPAKKKAAAKKR